MLDYMKLEFHHTYGHLPKWLYFLLIFCLLVAVACVLIGCLGLLGFGPAA